LVVQRTGFIPEYVQVLLGQGLQVVEPDALEYFPDSQGWQ
jgi:hypothetical protein